MSKTEKSKNLGDNVAYDESMWWGERAKMKLLDISCDGVTYDLRERCHTVATDLGSTSLQGSTLIINTYIQTLSGLIFSPLQLRRMPDLVVAKNGMLWNALYVNRIPLHVRRQVMREYRVDRMTDEDHPEISTIILSDVGVKGRPEARARSSYKFIHTNTTPLQEVALNIEVENCPDKNNSTDKDDDRMAAYLRLIY